MTLILALRCQDGVVLASDSQATLATSGQHTREHVDKLHTLVGSLGWGGSGSGGLIQRIQERLLREKDLPKVFESQGQEEGAKRLARVVAEIQREAADAFVDIPKMNAKPETAGGIFVGLAKGKPFILELDPHGARHFITSSHSAIGSGDLFATHAMGSVAHYNVTALDLDRALALAYRTVDDAIHNAAYGLGGDVQLLTVTTRSTHCLAKEEIAPIKDLVALWKQQESDVLGKLSRAPVPEAPSEDPPSE